MASSPSSITPAIPIAPPGRWLFVDRKTLAHVVTSGPAEGTQEALTPELLDWLRARGKQAVESSRVAPRVKEIIRQRWRAIRAWAAENMGQGQSRPDDPSASQAQEDYHLSPGLLELVGTAVRWPARDVAGTVHSVSSSGSVYILRADGCFTTVPWDMTSELEREAPSQ